MAKQPPIDVQQRAQFRRRLFLLLLLILLILLFGRACSAGQATTSTPVVTLGDATKTPTTLPTITPIPVNLFTPVVTFSAIPPTFFPETHTIVPTLAPTFYSTPTPVSVRMQTPTPIVQITGRKCTGFGEDRGNVWVVAGCDTLSRISQVTGISLEELQAANPAIRDPDLIFPNQHIRLPGR